MTTTSSNDGTTTTFIVDNAFRLTVYASLVTSAIFITASYNRIDLHYEGTSLDLFRERRDDWSPISVVRSLIDLITERLEDLKSSPSTTSVSRVTSVRRAAERLLAAHPNERALDGLRYLASVIRYYREHVTSERLAGRESITPGTPEIDAVRMDEVVQTLGRLVVEAAARRQNEVDVTVTTVQHPVSLSLHSGPG